MFAFWRLFVKYVQNMTNKSSSSIKMRNKFF